MTQQSAKQSASGNGSNGNRAVYPETETEVEVEPKPDSVSEADANSSRATGSTTGNSNQVALLPLLDNDAATKAVNFILATWPNAAPMTAGQREAWMDVLTLMRPGELKRALAARTDDKSHRPEPYAILEIVNNLRARDARLAREERERRAHEERRADMSAPVTPTTVSAAEQVFTQFRDLPRPYGHRRGA